MQCVRRHGPRIAHVHVKDVDEVGNWQALGQGSIDWRAFVYLLRQFAYSGWIVAEEESARARADQIAAVTGNRAYLQSLGL